jgi:tetratricopeptide (TPR) repeat protein
MMSPLVSALVCTAALTVGQTNLQPEAARIAEAARQLGDPAFDVRQKATEDLWRAGSAAEAELRAALKSPDPEVRTRAAAVLGRLRLGIRPETPLDVRVLIEQFLYGGSGAARRQALAELQAKADWRTILNLIRGEENPAERQALAAIVASEIGKVLRPLLEQGKLDEAHELLDLLATSDQGLSQLAAFLVLTGRLDTHIQLTRLRVAASAHDDDARQLMHLVRANGDFSAAADAAPSSTDALQRAKLLAAAQRWEEAATAAADLYTRDPTRHEAAALAATFHRLAANDVGYKSVIDQLTKAVKPEGNKAKPQAEPPADPFAPASPQPNMLAWTLCETLLINEQPEPALAILRSINPQFAHAILWRQHRHAEALEFAGISEGKPLDRSWLDKLPVAPHVARIDRVQLTARCSLAAQAARQLRELGRKQQVEEILGTLRAIVTEDNDQGTPWLTIALLDWQLGRFEDVGRDAARALAVGTKPPTMFGVILKQQGALAAFWFNVLTEQNPQLDRAKAFEQSLWLVVPQPPPGRLPADWRQLVADAHAKTKTLPVPERNQRLILLGQTCLIRGDRDLARKFFAEAAESDLAVAVRVGDLDAASQDWAAAAAWYEKAARPATSEALAIYLHGHALTKSGQAEAGAERIKLASLLALAPEARSALAAGLQERGLKSEAAEQFELVSRTAPIDSSVVVNAAQQVGNLVNGKEPLHAAECWQQLLLHVLGPNTNFSEVEGYLTLPHIIHKVRARSLLADGKPDEAVRELEQAERTLPGDVRLIVEFVPRLDRAGQTAAAEKLFQQGFGAHQQVCEAFPTSATFHNNAAWLAARSQRKLDEAFALVTKAIGLVPEEAAYHDTLAEVHFQRGDREAAVASARRAVELSGESKLSATRLKHFEMDELKTLDGTESEGN